MDGAKAAKVPWFRAQSFDPFRTKKENLSPNNREIAMADLLDCGGFGLWVAVSIIIKDTQILAYSQ